jgi:alcohol dehydrogenase class IV
MINQFQFARLPLILFGSGKRAELPRLVKKTGTRIILVTGSRSFIDSRNGKDLMKMLTDSGISFQHCFVSSEPSPEIIDKAVSSAAGFSPEAVLAIGGGSVLDAGKAISAMVPLKEPIIGYLEGVGTMEHPGLKIPFIAVPTTSGTGSEATKNAVISNIGNDGFKKSLRHDNFVPDIALVDPELTLGCPPELTAASGMDCFTQLTEAYLSDKANEYTDALAFEGIKAVKTSLLRCYHNGDDAEARTGMSFAALTSGICLANAGLGIVHGFASSIGGLYEIPHGLICGTLMGVANEINVRVLRNAGSNPAALKKYAKLGELFIGGKQMPDDYFIDGFINKLHELTVELNLPGLKSSGVEKHNLEKICESTECKNNPVKLTGGEILEIVNRRFL